ncbi:MAG: dihydrodipicolinate synthase family protein [Litorilinea sp.]|nr:MAG: dihydrodipicolinate synthase family protein [Litorilinea sp.]
MELSAIQQALHTVSAIPVTPFTESGEADFATYAALVERMVAGGITVVTPNGNTGEFYSLTPEEHRAAVQAAVAGAQGKALVLAGVGFDAATAAAMAREAASLGAHAVMVHQPVHPYRSDEGWIAYHKAIADAVPALGVVPYVRDAAIGAAALGGLADACPNFVGVKYAVANPQLFATLVRQVGPDRLAWICGIAESWAPFFWPGGAHGFTSGLVNVITGPSLQMQQALEQGDYARAMAIWAQVRPFEELRARRNNANNVSAVKEAMAQMGLCSRTVRPPISELPEAERQEVTQILATLGVAEKA